MHMMIYQRLSEIYRNKIHVHVLKIYNDLKVRYNNPFVPTTGSLMSMLNIQFCKENSFVLPKPYLAEMYIEHAHQHSTKGSRMYSQK